MPEEKVARSFSAALIVLMIAFVPLYVLFGFGFAAACLLYGLVCAAIGTAVGLGLGKRHAVLQIASAALPAAAAAFAVPIGISGAQIARDIMLGAGALLSVWAERLALRPADAGRKVGLLLAPLAVMLAASAVLWLLTRSAGETPEGLWLLMIAIAAAWFVAALFLLNRLALRQAASTGNQRGIPAGVRRMGAIGAAVFAAAVFLLASSGAILQAIVAAVRQLIAWLIAAYLFLNSLFLPAEEELGPLPTGTPDMLPPAEEASPIMALIYNILFWAILLAVAAAVIYALVKLLPKLWKWLLGRINWLASTWRQDEGYVDRSESLLSPRHTLVAVGLGVKRFTRFFRRRPRLGDFPTNAGKARFLFRERLRGLIAARREPPPGATASDIAGDAAALARAYNLARYAEQEPEDSDIKKAREEMGLK